MNNADAIRILKDGVLNGKDDTPKNNEAIETAISDLESIDRITAERDAAIADLKGDGTDCHFCVFYDNNECKKSWHNDDNVDECWEWRGTQNE